VLRFYAPKESNTVNRKKTLMQWFLCPDRCKYEDVFCATCFGFMYSICTECEKTSAKMTNFWPRCKCDGYVVKPNV